MATNERERILSLLEAGRITAEQAATLLEAIPRGLASERHGGPPRPPAPPGPPRPRPPAQVLRIRIDADEGEKSDGTPKRTRVHVNVPLKLARFAARFLPPDARHELDRQGIDLVQLLEELGDEVPDGPLVDIDAGGEDDERKRARIRIEVA